MKRLTRKTKRLIIRPLESGDHHAWCEAYSTMQDTQNIWDEGNWHEEFLTRAEFRKELKFQKDLRDRDKSYILAVFRKDDGALLGFVSLMDISRGIFQNAYLGYRIFNPHWGLGYAPEAAGELLKIAFKVLRLHRIEAGIHPANRASIAVAKKLGLKKESLSRKRLFTQGQWQDMALYTATSEDFKLKYLFPKE